MYIVYDLFGKISMKELIKKTFTFKVLWKDIYYDQLSYYEALEFDNMMKQTDFDIIERFIWFLGKYKIKRKLILKRLSIADMNLFFQTYIDTALRWYYAKNKKTNEDKPKNNDKRIPQSSYIVFLSKEMWVDPIRLVNEYTPEALNFISEWIQRNLNEQTKEGRARNRQVQIGRELNDIDKDKELEELKKMRERKKPLQAKKDK